MKKLLVVVIQLIARKQAAASKLFQLFSQRANFFLFFLFFK